MTLFFEERHYEQWPLWRSFLPKSHKRKKSTTCSGANLTTVSVCVGICRALPFALFSYERHRLHSKIRNNPEERHYEQQPLWRAFLPKSHKRKRPQHAPEQTYRRISLRRSMLRSFLYLIQLRTPQGYIALQVTIVFNFELCYTWSIKKRAINVSLALGSSRNNKM